MAFEVQRHLDKEDLGEETEDGFFLKDLGRVEDESPGPSFVAPAIDSNTPLSRVEREKVPLRMAGQLMDYYMKPEILNNPTILNPIRDGIPQCRKHPFKSGSRTEIGCIYGCGTQERDGAGNLPVAKDHTLGDTWMWVKALVIHATAVQDKRIGYAKAVDLGGN